MYPCIQKNINLCINPLILNRCIAHSHVLNESNITFDLLGETRDMPHRNDAHNHFSKLWVQTRLAQDPVQWHYSPPQQFCLHTARHTIQKFLYEASILQYYSDLATVFRQVVHPMDAIRYLSQKYSYLYQKKREITRNSPCF